MVCHRKFRAYLFSATNIFSKTIISANSMTIPFYHKGLTILIHMGKTRKKQGERTLNCRNRLKQSNSLLRQYHWQTKMFLVFIHCLAKLVYLTKIHSVNFAPYIHANVFQKKQLTRGTPTQFMRKPFDHSET